MQQVRLPPLPARSRHCRRWEAQGSRTSCRHSNVFARHRYCWAANSLIQAPHSCTRPPTAQIDAFTDAPFGGNPAAVVLVPSTALPLPDAMRQAVAGEMNLSETAYLETADGSDDFAACTRFALRWFTPAIEVPLCGHATLASAAAIFFGEGNPAPQLRFDTLSGELVVTRQAAAAAVAAGSSGDASGSSSAAAGDLLSMDLPLVDASAADLPAGMEPGSALVQVGLIWG